MNALSPPPLVGAAPPPLKDRLTLRRLDDSQNPLPAIIAAAYERPVVRQMSLMGPYFVVSDPEGVKRVLVDNVANYPKTRLENRLFGAAFGESLVSAEGETWRAHRRLMAPSFAPPSVAAYAPGMAEEVLAFQARWDAAPATPVDVARDMSALTLAIISRAMFSADGAALAGVVESAITRGLAALRLGLGDALPGLGELRMRARNRRMAAIFAELDAAVAKLIAAREASGPQADLLSRLIAARDGDGDQRLSAREVRDEVVTIFLVGHETSAVAMAWIWYLLSQHPEVEARLHAELDAVLGGRAPRSDDLAALPYTRQVAEETLRLYPPTPGTSSRVALAADEICGVAIPKGAIVCCLPWVTQRHKALWDHPDRFDPERFSPRASAGRPRFAWFPFGGGPRVCIGAAFAMTEIQIILAALAQRFRLRLAPGHTVAFHRQITLRPRGGLPMIVERR